MKKKFRLKKNHEIAAIVSKRQRVAVEHYTMYYQKRNDGVKIAISASKKYGNAVTCTSFFETPIISTKGEIVEDMPLKRHTYTAQAPQSFVLGEIVEAHEKMRMINPDYEDIADSCNLYVKLGKTMHIVEGNRGNIKVTTPEDFYILRALLQYRENEQILGIR